MSSKRNSTQSSTNSENQSKKVKVNECNNYLHKTLREGGLILKYPPDKCIVLREAAFVIRSIKKGLEKHFDYPRNVSDFFIHLENEWHDISTFKHNLYPNIVLAGENDEERLITDSVIKILLSIPILQSKLIDLIFEKAIELTSQPNCASCIQMILKCLSTLDSIIDGEKVTTNLINLLDITSDKLVRLEIITAIPDIINDQQHNIVAQEMSRILNEDHEIIPAILDCLSNLILNENQYEELQKKTINILTSLTKFHFFPNFVKFLLIPGRLNDNGYFNAVQGLRDGIGWPTSIVSPQEIASNQVITATAIRNSMVSCKIISGIWLRTISLCKIHTDHKPIDFIILLILYSTSEDKKRQVENLIRKQTRLNIFKEELLDKTFDEFKPVLKDYLRTLIALANALLKTQGDPLIESLTIHIYTLMFSHLNDCCQTIVAELLQLGLDSKQCVMTILLILNNVASKDMSYLNSQSVQMLILLDRLDDMSIMEIKAVMNLLCGLAYSYENSLIRDDIHMIIRKELSSSNPQIKVQGILAGVYSVKYLMATIDGDDRIDDMSNNISRGDISTSLLPEGNLREAAQIVELISRSTQQFPEMIVFFYDELSHIISSASYINRNFLSWLTEAVTNDLKQNFIVSTIEEKYVDELKLTMQYCLNEGSEIDDVIAINVAGLTLKTLKSEQCIAILSPLFQLVRILYSIKDNNLSGVDALLGCPIVMPNFDIETIEDCDQVTVTKILDCLVHTVNWFRELLNAFSLNDDNGLKSKTLNRLRQTNELQSLISDILLKTKISYKLPSFSMNINRYLRKCIKENKVTGVQGCKQKIPRKVLQNEIDLPDTAKTQGTQNVNSTITSKQSNLYNIQFRPLNLNLLKLLSNDLCDDSQTNGELNVRLLTFLLKCLNSNLENEIISKIKKKTYFSKQTNNYDSKKGAECAKSVSRILHKLIEHLHFVTIKIDKYTSENVSNESSNVLYTTEMLDYLLCLECIYNMYSIYFKWIGFKDRHCPLFKSSLRTIASSENAKVSSKDLVITVIQELAKQQKYCLQLSTAVSLIDLIKTMQSYTDDVNMLSILRNMARDFLSQQWKTPEGLLEKGQGFNQSVDHLASIYLINNEILELKRLTLQLTHDVKLLKSNKDSLNCFRSINRSNFPILYRNIGTSLHDVVSTSLKKPMSNSEHINLWNDVAFILKYMSDIAKFLDNRSNLSAFFKKTLPVLKLFMSHGVPMLELQFKSETEEVLEILKTLQQSTRFLQSLCCHSRLKKDTALMSKVPYARQLLETLIYKVKAALAANNCSEAFWMGNLRNKDIHGDVIVSQINTDDEAMEDCDDQLPEDDDSDEIDEFLNPDSGSISDIV